MEPLSGLAVVAGVAGVTRILSSNVDAIVRAIGERMPTPKYETDRLVVAEPDSQRAHERQESISNR